MMKVALTGASGFVGTVLQEHFKDTIYIHRDDDEAFTLQKLDGVDVVINLAGAPILKRWSDPYKKVLLQSRVDTTATLVSAINRSNVKHFISTSAIGIYPDDMSCDESCTDVAGDFLGLLSQKWETEALKCNKPTTILRFGVILGKNGGALAQMLTPFKLGVGGIIGDGKMMTSWIHMDDLMGMYHYVIENKLTGMYNATAPHPVSNYTFTKALGKALRRPTVLPLPVFALKLMYGEASTVLTGSKEVYPRKIQDAGYTFKFQDIEEALEDIVTS
ncbi:MAG: Cell division inhibitor [uncultured Sulfurovum sp.]|uniref:Cell division inhibitor n=1 Tax=uncultured Sulfurovum sp. TaxID=269237 RepID=A0A6S6U3T6_9BACT|nr:MAG: Cell division inhibitor [uncultured Sulfurovum sp.]